ncbi:MAG: hypothetical protein EG823_04680 [Actinobacteria bacterium]|nr:hypothetical protein [Actinomycetota bacterium]
MSMLGVMVGATCALYGMEMDFVHRPVVGRDNCCLVKWTEGSITRICWSEGDPDRLEFQVRIHLPGGLSLDDRERLVALLDVVSPSGEDALPVDRTARLDGDDLIVESTIPIQDASYVGEVEQAYMQVLQDVMTIENSLH